MAAGTWECSGFERDGNGRVVLLWECKQCGYEVGGGMNPPDIDCPHCKAGRGEDS